MDGKSYGAAAVALTLVGVLGLFCILLAQGVLPGNPEHVTGLAPDLALNMAISFATNTDWQAAVSYTHLTWSIGSVFSMALVT